MTRAQQRVKRAAKRKCKASQQAAQQQALVARIDTLIQPYGSRVIALGASAVGVQGDARTYGISVVIRVSIAHANEVSTLITNRIREVTRVLMDLEFII